MKKSTFLSNLCILLLLIISVALFAEEEQPSVNMIFFDTDLREALNEISLQTGVNIIVDQTVSGIVSAELEDVPLEKALQMLLISGGYTYRRIDDFYFVGLADIKNTSFTELSEIEVIELKYIDVVSLLDLIPVSLKDYVKGNQQHNIITINAPTKQLEKILEIINKVDLSPKQVEVKVLVTAVDSRYIEEYGSELFSFTDTANITKGISYDTGSNLLSIQGDVYGQLLSKIKLLEEDKMASIEADPRIIIAEGESAELFIGDQQILLLNSEDDDIATRIEKINVGVGLKVTAERIVEDSIILNIAPEVSHLVNSQGSDIIIKENSVSTTISLMNGQTIAIAGMTLSGQSSHSKGIPYLNEIPLLRWFFMSDEKSQTETELLVFVTPVIR